MFNKYIALNFIVILLLISSCQTSPKQPQQRPSRIPEGIRNFLKTADENDLVGIGFHSDKHQRETEAIEEISRQLSSKFSGTAVNFYSGNADRYYTFYINLAGSLSYSSLSAWLKENGISKKNEYNEGDWYAVAYEIPENVRVNYPQPIMPVITLFTIDEAIKSVALNISDHLPSGSTIAIINISGAKPDDAEFIIEELSTELVKISKEEDTKGQYSIVERSAVNLAAIKTEQDFQMTGDVSDDSIVSIGKFLGADVVITGSITGANEFRRLRVKALNVETAKLLIQTNLKVRDLN